MPARSILIGAIQLPALLMTVSSTLGNPIPKNPKIAPMKMERIIGLSNRLNDSFLFVSIQKPNVYVFDEDCYLWFGDYNKLKDYIINLQESEAYYYGFYKDYKSRIDKALEIIRKGIVNKVTKGKAHIDLTELLNILEGSDKE